MRLIIFLNLFVFSSCSHFVKKESLEKKPAISHQESASALLYQSLSSPYKSSYPDIPLVSHASVDKWIHYFENRGRGHMQNYLERSARYIPLMQSVLKEKGLPLNLVYVALIESGFSSKAHSRANAVGYWQFIYGTGKRYGLKIDGYVDERRDPVLSTRAASNYFKDLYSLFGSWPLALSAYNAGEYRINRAVLKHYHRDFWHLSSKKALPRETRNYVPKLIAAIHIAKNPAKYGFKNLNYQAPLRFELLKTEKPISLLKLAKHLSVSYQDIKNLNPMYKGEYVPVYEEKTILRIPLGLMSLAQTALDKSLMNRPAHSYHYHYWYRVRRGDSLYSIARRHRTTVKKIRKANRLGSSSLIRIGQKLKIPSRNLVATKKKPVRAPNSKSSNKEFHVVKKGDNLFQLASRYGLTVSQLKALNHIQGNPLIHPGQKLRIKKQSQKKPDYHTVKRGDTLIGIAKKHNISLPKLMKANSMTFKSILLTGTRLVIPK